MLLTSKNLYGHFLGIFPQHRGSQYPGGGGEVPRPGADGGRGRKSCIQNILRRGQIPLSHQFEAVPLCSCSCASAVHGPPHWDGQHEAGHHEADQAEEGWWHGWNRDQTGRRNYEVDGLWRLLRCCELYLYYIRLVMEYSFYFSYQDKHHQAIYLPSQSTKWSWEKYWVKTEWQYSAIVVNFSLRFRQAIL